MVKGQIPEKHGKNEPTLKIKNKEIKSTKGKGLDNNFTIVNESIMS